MCISKLLEIYKPTKDRTADVMGGMDVNSTVIVPKSPIERLDSAAARGSVFSRSAVAIADEFAPSVTPRVT